MYCDKITLDYMKLRRTKNMRAARGARGRRARTRKRQRGGENNDTAAPAEVDKITQLFNDLIEEKNYKAVLKKGMMK